MGIIWRGTRRLVSANKEPDKLAKAGLHTTKSAFVNAPLIDELPMSLECKLVKITEDGNIIGQIMNISADERILDADGQIDPAKLQAISYDSVQNAYRVIGEKVGNAFSDGSKLK